MGGEQLLEAYLAQITEEARPTGPVEPSLEARRDIERRRDQARFDRHGLPRGLAVAS